MIPSAQSIDSPAHRYRTTPHQAAAGRSQQCQELASGNFPHLATVISPADVASFAADHDARFELGLSVLLEGIAARYR